MVALDPLTPPSRDTRAKAKKKKKEKPTSGNVIQRLCVCGTQTVARNPPYLLPGVVSSPRLSSERFTDHPLRSSRARTGPLGLPFRFPDNNDTIENREG